MVTTRTTSQNENYERNMDILRSKIESRDITIRHLKNKQQQLQKENELLKKRLNELGNPMNENTMQKPVVVVGKRKHRRRSTEIPAMPEKLDSPNIDKSHIKQHMHENHTNLVREVIQEKLKEANYQQRERKRRSNNIIIHGLQEKTGTYDEELVANLFDKMHFSHTPKSITRLGKKTATNTRPVKVVMATLTEKKNIMRSLPNLKNTEYTRLSITNDYTKNDRKIISEWVKEAELRNTIETGTSSWKVKGSPSTKLRLVKVERTIDTTSVKKKKYDAQQTKIANNETNERFIEARPWPAKLTT